jgi:hypothetical protein
MLSQLQETDVPEKDGKRTNYRIFIEWAEVLVLEQL